LIRTPCSRSPRSCRLEALVLELRERGYQIYRIVEHDTAGRTATVRLLARHGVLVDLLAASSGVEPEVVASSTPIELEPIGSLPVASAEDLLALKVLAESPGRPQDMIHALSLLRVVEALDLDRVRARLDTIAARGFERGQDLSTKLEEILRRAGRRPP
jgi:hypothetical protein